MPEPFVVARSAPRPQVQIDGTELLAVISGVKVADDVVTAAGQLGFLSYHPGRARLPRRFGMGRSPDVVGTVVATGTYDPRLDRIVAGSSFVGDPVSLWLELGSLVRHVVESLQDAAILRGTGDQVARRRLVRHLRARSKSLWWTAYHRGVRIEAADQGSIRSAPDLEIVRLALGGLGRLIEDRADLVDGFSIRLVGHPSAGGGSAAVGLHAQILLALAHEWGRVAVGAEPVRFDTCAQCRRTFSPSRRGQKWCSRTCRQLGYYYNKRAKTMAHGDQLSPTGAAGAGPGGRLRPA